MDGRAVRANKASQLAPSSSVAYLELPVIGFKNSQDAEGPLKELFFNSVAGISTAFKAHSLF